jgi:hypothetical protein
MKDQVLEGFSFTTYEDISNNITNYYQAEDKLYNNNDSLTVTDTDEFVLGSNNIVGTYKCNDVINIDIDPEYTYYISHIEPSSSTNKYIVDVHNGKLTIRSKTCDSNATDLLTIARQKFVLGSTNTTDEDEDSPPPYDEANMYYRIDSISTNTNYKLIGNVIVFNNIHSEQVVNGISVTSTRYTRNSERKYYHGANDGIFEIENKNSLVNAMNQDVKVMIKQNEQLMILGTLTAATFLVGAYVLMRN